MSNRELIEESLAGEVQPEDLYDCIHCRDSGFSERGAYCTCGAGADMRRFDENEKYECMKCRDSGQGEHPGMYCKCRFGEELKNEEGAAYDDYGW